MHKMTIKCLVMKARLHFVWALTSCTFIWLSFIEAYYLRHSFLVVYPLASAAASVWLCNRMCNHVTTADNQIRCIKEIEQAANAIRLPDQYNTVPLRHRTINYVTKYKQRGKYAK